MNEAAWATESWDIPVEEFKWRIMRTYDTDNGVRASYAAYPDARVVSIHLDRLFTPAGWEDEYRINPDNRSVVCILRIRMGDEWIRKSDVGNVTDIEPMKGGFSDAFKRAAAKAGVGRNAYEIPEIWGPVYSRGDKHFKPKTTDDGKPFDDWLVERAYDALGGVGPQAKEKPRPSEPEVADDAPVVEETPDSEAWTQFMETMTALKDEGKGRVKTWWLENGDGTSKPSKDTDEEALQKVAFFATSVLMETELGAEPF